jgi:hypothetical protein
MPRKKASRKLGEPRPTPEAPAAVNPVPASRCRKCQSTLRSCYSNTKRQTISGIEPGTHLHYTAVVWRTCRCGNCGQARVDRTYEYAPAQDPA